MILFLYRGLEYFTVITLALVYFRFRPGGTDRLTWMNEFSTTMVNFDYSTLLNNIVSKFNLNS